jgi:hypothetical protein
VSPGPQSSFAFKKIKEQVNEFDKKTRSIVGTLNRIHTTPMSSSAYASY